VEDDLRFREQGRKPQVSVIARQLLILVQAEAAQNRCRLYFLGVIATRGAFPAEVQDSAVRLRSSISESDRYLSVVAKECLDPQKFQKAASQTLEEYPRLDKRNPSKWKGEVENFRSGLN